MYGPIRPPTNAIGRIAAITVKRREDRRVADLVDGARRRRAASGSRRGSRGAVARDVLDDDDRVVDEDADREDEREERDAVERVAVEVEDDQREGERRPGSAISTTTDSRRPSASQIRTRHRDDAMTMCQSSSLDFSLGRLAVVARDRDVHVARAAACRAAASTFADDRVATASMAFAPLRFATEIVTAGSGLRRACGHCTDVVVAALRRRRRSSATSRDDTRARRRSRRPRRRRRRRASRSTSPVSTRISRLPRDDVARRRRGLPPRERRCDRERVEAARGERRRDRDRRAAAAAGRR